MASINSSRSNALSVLQCNCCQKKNCDIPLHCYLSHLASSNTSTCFTDILKLFKLHVLSIFINRNYFLWELNAQNLMMKMIHCYNLLWNIKGPRLLWIYFLLYQHQCTQNTLKLQETSVFNFLEIVWLMVSHQIFNLTRHTLFQNVTIQGFTLSTSRQAYQYPQFASIKPLLVWNFHFRHKHLGII